MIQKFVMFVIVINEDNNATMRVTAISYWHCNNDGGKPRSKRGLPSQGGKQGLAGIIQQKAIKHQCGR